VQGGGHGRLSQANARLVVQHNARFGRSSRITVALPEDATRGRNQPHIALDERGYLEVVRLGRASARPGGVQARALPDQGAFNGPRTLYRALPRFL